MPKAKFGHLFWDRPGTIFHQKSAGRPVGGQNGRSVFSKRPFGTLPVRKSTVLSASRDFSPDVLLRKGNPHLRHRELQFSRSKISKRPFGRLRGPKVTSREASAGSCRARCCGDRVFFTFWPHAFLPRPRVHFAHRELPKSRFQNLETPFWEVSGAKVAAPRGLRAPLWTLTAAGGASGSAKSLPEGSLGLPVALLAECVLT